MADVDAHQVSLLQSASLTELGARIKHARLAAGLTQTQLGGPEATVSYVSRIESGRRRPDPRVLDAFAERLGVSVDELLDGPPAANEQETRLAVDFVALSLELGDAADALSQAERLLADPDVPAPSRSACGSCAAGRSEALGRLDDAVEAYEDLLAAHPAGEFALAAESRSAAATASWGDLGRAISVGEHLLASVAERGLAGGDEAVQLTVTVAAAYHRAWRHGVRRATLSSRRSPQRSSRDRHAAVPLPTGTPRSWSWRPARLTARCPLAAKALALLERGRRRSEPCSSSLRSSASCSSSWIRRSSTRRWPTCRLLLEQMALLERWADRPAAQRPRPGRGCAHERVTWRERDTLASPESSRRRGSDAPLLAADARTLQGQAAAADGRRGSGGRAVQQAVYLLTGVGADREAGQRWLELGTLLESVGEDDAARQAYRSAAASAGLRVRPRATARAEI